MAETQVAKREEQAARPMQAAGRERIYVPDVDIAENGETLRVLANMPGVAPESVDVSVENNVLTLEGEARVEAPQGYELAGCEYSVGRFRRDFTLPDSVDASGIKARVQNGVLELTIPKREEVRTRKIRIESE